MASHQPIRIIHDHKGQEYILTPEGMFTTKEEITTENGSTYRFFHLREPSLTRPVVQRIFRVKTGRTQNWVFTVTDTKVRIGCKIFVRAAVVGLKRWCGIL